MDYVAHSSGVDDAAYQKPIGRRAASRCGGVQGRSVLVKVRARNHNHEDTQRIGKGQEVYSGEDAEEPREGSASRMGKTRSGQGKVDIMERGQGKGSRLDVRVGGC
jgi:hypothetical protein